MSSNTEDTKKPKIKQKANPIAALTNDGEILAKLLEMSCQKKPLPYSSRKDEGSFRKPKFNIS